MTTEEKLEINKKIRKYEGTNSFLISLQKQLKSTKAQKIDLNGKVFKILSDKQYQVAKDLFSLSDLR